MPVVLLIAVPVVLYSVVTFTVFSGRPLNLDAITQALQARIFLQGRLSVPAPAHPAFFSSLLMVTHGGVVFSQFPPGWAALLALGFALGVPWLMAPLLTAVATYALYLLLREDGSSPGTALFTGLLFAFAPWTVFNAASWMNHLPAVSFILLGTLALARGMRRPESWVMPGLAATCFGVATLIRPLEGVAFGLPATVWMIARATRARRERGHWPAWKGFLAFLGGGAVTLGILFAFNRAQQGGALTFGYQTLWGFTHNLGFHAAPWGASHTPVRGIELLNGYLLPLQIVFFEAPAPALIPALVALLLARRFSAVDRFLGAGSLLVLAGYFGYWSEGHYLGPRYLLPLAPVVAIWTVRLGQVLRERTGRDGTKRWAHASVALLVVAGWLMGVPSRWRQYRTSDIPRRVSVRALRSPEAERAIVFVPSGWHDQVTTRLWATGMTRPQAQWLINRVGLCRLELGLGSLERRHVGVGALAFAELREMVDDSTRLLPLPRAGEPVDPYIDLPRRGDSIPELCLMRQRMASLAGGFLIQSFSAQIGNAWDGRGPLIARELNELDRHLLAEHPDRKPYVLRPVGMAGGLVEFRLQPLAVDSARLVWDALDRLKEMAPPG